MRCRSKKTFTNNRRMTDGLMMPWVCLQFVIVVFPDHTHLLFWKKTDNNRVPKLDIWPQGYKKVQANIN